MLTRCKNLQSREQHTLLGRTPQYLYRIHLRTRRRQWSAQRHRPFQDNRQYRPASLGVVSTTVRIRKTKK
ncbi:unnamed protein product [Amoebophrya sp. A120]|nr:unnamed protein product [Amoebophrya sp. A120]|eukprot:GSA120T00003941001.1